MNCRTNLQIRSFRGQYSALSNFGGAPFTMNDITNPNSRHDLHDDPMFNTPNVKQHPATAEHHFQALKTLSMRERWWVYGAPTPNMAKSRGRLVTMRADWPSDNDGQPEFSLLAMSAILTAKFAVPTNRKVLLGTENFDLIEGNMHHDQMWGDCECVRHQNTPGQNLLGKLLMRERTLILAGQH